MEEELFKELKAEYYNDPMGCEFPYEEWLESELLKSREECKKAYDAGYKDGTDSLLIDAILKAE